MLGGDEARRSRIVAWREGLGPGGRAAGIRPAAAGWRRRHRVVLAMALAAGWWAGRWAPRPVPLPLADRSRHRRWAASAGACGPFAGCSRSSWSTASPARCPATLVLFFVPRPPAGAGRAEPLFLASYFLCAALSMPLWVRARPRASGWRAPGCAGMLLAVAAFAGLRCWARATPAAFPCRLRAQRSALGADLALPGALLAGLISRGRPRARAGRRLSSAGGTSPPSSTWRSPRASRLPLLSPGRLRARQRAMPLAALRWPSPIACCPAC